MQRQSKKSIKITKISTVPDCVRQGWRMPRPELIASGEHHPAQCTPIAPEFHITITNTFCRVSRFFNSRPLDRCARSGNRITGIGVGKIFELFTFGAEKPFFVVENNVLKICFRRNFLKSFPRQVV